MFFAVVVILHLAMGGQVMGQEVRPERGWRTMEECVVNTGVIVSQVINEQNNERIIGYSVACVRAEEA